MMGTWMCFRVQCQCEKEEEKRWKERERIMRVNQLKDTCFTNPKQRNYTIDKCLISNEKTIGIVSNYIKKFDEVRKKNVGLLFFGE
ncbi:ATP-binding protein, partial [Streptococcus pyogenes]